MTRDSCAVAKVKIVILSVAKNPVARDPSVGDSRLPQDDKQKNARLRMTM